MSEQVIPSTCPLCKAFHTGPLVLCGVCARRIWQASNIDPADWELMKLKMLGSEQRKRRELAEWERQLQAGWEAMI